MTKNFFTLSQSKSFPSTIHISEQLIIELWLIIFLFWQNYIILKSLVQIYNFFYNYNAEIKKKQKKWLSSQTATFST